MTKTTPEESVDRPGASAPAKARGLTRIVRATGYSLAGLKAVFQYEAAFRQEVAMAAVLSPLAFLVGRNPVEISLLIGSLLIVSSS